MANGYVKKFPVSDEKLMPPTPYDRGLKKSLNIVGCCAAVLQAN